MLDVLGSLLNACTKTDTNESHSYFEKNPKRHIKNDVLNETWKKQKTKRVL